jgi:hypothetical protein
MSDIDEAAPLELAKQVIEHNDHIIAIDAMLNGDERLMGKLARALIALHEECARLRPVYEAAVTFADEERNDRGSAAIELQRLGELHDAVDVARREGSG